MNTPNTQPKTPTREAVIRAIIRAGKIEESCLRRYVLRKIARTFVTIALGALLLTGTAKAGLTECTAHPNCSVIASPQHGTAPFTAVFHYTLGGQPVNVASIDYGDGQSEALLPTVRVGRLVHVYSTPGVYTPFLSVYNDCGGAIVFLFVTVQ